MTITAFAAKAIAREWAADHVVTIPDVVGAFLHGSINELAADAPLATTSDVDVMVVVSGAEPMAKPGKFRYRDLLLDVSYLPVDEVTSASLVLGQYHLAGSFRQASVLVDPTGTLTQLQTAVSSRFAQREWVTRRCEHARSRVLSHLRFLEAAETFPEQVTSWLFATGVTTHVLLVAGLRNPTVRRRYVAVRELLADYRRLDFYNSLLEMLGCEHITRKRVQRHLAALEEVFDATRSIIVTPFPFAADISDEARSVTIDGSRAFITAGDHREAMFWIIATYSRCMTVLQQDGTPELAGHFDRRYRSLLEDVGIATHDDMLHRGGWVKQSLTDIWSVAELIIAENPEIRD